MVNEAVVTGLKVAPITGDIWDIYSGGTKLFNPDLTWQQRALGAGQMGLGVAGLATLGTGSLAKSGIKGLGKYAGKYGTKKFMTKAAKEKAIKGGANRILTNVKAGVGNVPYNSAIMANNLNKGIMRGAEGFNSSLIGKVGGFVNSHPLLSVAGLEGANLFLGDENSTPKDVTQEQVNSDVASGVTRGSSGYGGGSYGYNVGGSGSVGGLTPEQKNNILQQIARGGGNGSYGYDNDAMAMAQEYMYNQQMMEPYRRNLQNYIRDYNNRADLAYNQDKELALLASLTGASGLNNMIGKNNALVNEANRIGLMKTSGEDLKGVGEGMQTLLGNIALAKQTGLPLRAANADTKMAQLAVNKMIADDRNENRLAVEQYKGQIKMQLAQSRARLEAARRSGNRAQTNRALSEYLRVVKAANDYGITADDIYRNTGRRFDIPANIGQPGEVRLDR